MGIPDSTNSRGQDKKGGEGKEARTPGAFHRLALNAMPSGSWVPLKASEQEVLWCLVSQHLEQGQCGVSE